MAEVRNGNLRVANEPETTATAVERLAVTRSTAGIRMLMFDEIERVLNGDATHVRANSIARMCGVIVSSVQLELEAAKLKLRNGDKPDSPPPQTLELGFDPTGG